MVVLYGIKDIRYAFINLRLENYLSQLVIVENAIIRNNLYAMQSVGMTSFPKYRSVSRMSLGSEGIVFSPPSNSITKSVISSYN